MHFAAKEMPGVSDMNGKVDEMKIQHRILDDKIVALEAAPSPRD